MAEETIEVGDRVRLKGDLGGPASSWMTVHRVDHMRPNPQNPDAPHGTFVGVAYWTLNDAGAAFLVTLQGIRPEALTKEPPPAKGKRT
jgi:hypothetical protein